MKLFKGLAEQIKKFDGKWGFVLKFYLIFSLIIICLLPISYIVNNTLYSLSFKKVAVIDVPNKDETVLDQIVLRLIQEGVSVNVTNNGIVQVPDEVSARRMRAILIREDLIPVGIDPWEIFDRERWTIKDFE